MVSLLVQITLYNNWNYGEYIIIPQLAFVVVCYSSSFSWFHFFNADFYISVNTNYYFQGSLYHLGSFEDRHCPILLYLLLSDKPLPSTPLCEVL